MSNRKKLSDIADILKIRKLEETVALSELGAALSTEKERKNDVAQAESDLKTARQDWRENLENTIIIPAVTQYLSRKLVDRHLERQQKQEDFDDAKSISKLKRSDWMKRDALVSQSLKAQKKCKRDLHRSRDEKRMSSLEDIVAFKWWCR